MPSKRTRGQSAGLSRQAILEAALSLADREGLKALSMRRIGQELGVEAMSLYQHVGNKDALLDGLVEHVFMQVTPHLSEGASWRDGLRHYAYALRDVLFAHPHVVPLVATRPAVTTKNLRLTEDALAALHATGVPVHTALDMLHAVTGFVVGHVLMLVGEGSVQESASGRAVAFREIDPAQFPLLAQAAQTSRPTEPALRFDFALEAMLRGFTVD